MEVIVPQLVEECPQLTESKGSLHYAQEPATCYYPEPHESSMFPRILFVIWTLFYHWCHGLASGSFPSGFPTRTHIRSHMCQMPHTCCPSLFNHINNIWHRGTNHEARHYAVFSSLLLPPLRPRDLPQYLFLNALSPCFFCNLRDQVSHPCRTTGEVIILLVLIFLYSR
jgi:hypothetical protein